MRLPHWLFHHLRVASKNILKYKTDVFLNKMIQFNSSVYSDLEVHAAATGHFTKVKLELLPKSEM